MPSPLLRALRWSAGDISFTIFLLTVVLCLLRARDLPTVELELAATGVSIGPADLALLATAVAAALRLRARGSIESRALLVVVSAFAVLILLSALPNGASAVVAAGKLVELGALTLGAVAFLESRVRLRALLTLLVGFAVAAAAGAAIGFVGGDGGRQASFLGEHDLAVIGNLALAVGLGRLHARRGNPGALAWTGIVAGVLAVVLGASFASLLGLYAAVVAIVAVSLLRRDVRWGAVLVTLAVALVATTGTLALRQGELGFIQSWFGPPAERPGEYAASWSQRLIYVYVGGRVFLDRPVLGTGWHGTLPPADFARYVPDARERFPDQPSHYFPAVDGEFVPQQTYDQILYELGLLGAALFAAMLALAVRQAIAAVRAAARRTARADAAYVPLAALGALGGALAGAALFGGSPLTSVFWLVLGIVAAAPRLARSPT